VGRDLTAMEQARVAIVHEHMAAVVAVSKDPAALPRLAALLADNFTWRTPSSDPGRGALRSRDLYLAIVSNPAFIPEPEQFVDLELKITATTAQGHRVAGEAESHSVRRDGTIYDNRYHQLWIFDDASKISEYRIYDDSEHVAAVHCESNIKIVRGFLDHLSSGDIEAAASLTADDLTWILRTGGTSETIQDKRTAFALIGDPQRKTAPPRVTPLSDGITAQGERVAMEAEVHHELAGGGAPQVEYRQFVFILNQCKIQKIREYMCIGASHWFSGMRADG
jgi:ketosteroid isomerase-like protein